MLCGDRLQAIPCASVILTTQHKHLKVKTNALHLKIIMTTKSVYERKYYFQVNNMPEVTFQSLTTKKSQQK